MHTNLEIRNGGLKHIQLADRWTKIAEQYVDYDLSIQATTDHYNKFVTAIQCHFDNAEIDCPQQNPADN